MPLPVVLRPSRFIRRKAIWDGILGGSNLWRAVAFVLFARDITRRLMGRNAEVVDVASFGSGRTMQIVTSKPLSKREAKRLKREGKLVPLGERRSEAVLWADAMDERRRERTRRRLFRRT